MAGAKEAAERLRGEQRGPGAQEASYPVKPPTPKTPAAIARSLSLPLPMLDARLGVVLAANRTFHHDPQPRIRCERLLDFLCGRSDVGRPVQSDAMSG